LSGGTALAAFHTGHRLSEDLDLFAAEPAPLEALLSFVRASGYAEPSYQHIFDRRLFLLPGTGPGKLKVEFTGYPFPSLGERLRVDGLEVDSLRDILANKLAAMTERSDAKDFVDVYVGLERHPILRLDALVDDAERKFGVKGLRHILAGRFLGHPPDPGSLNLRVSVDPGALHEFFSGAARAWVRQSLTEDANGG
jgi:hypothetical protein